MDDPKLFLTNKRPGDQLIFLGRKLSSMPFESILGEHWGKSRRPEGRALFVMEAVEWASLAEVVMLTMWISNLRNIGREVAVCLPYCGIFKTFQDNEELVDRRRAVCSFLSRWKFIKLMKELGVDVYGLDQFYFSWTELDDPLHCRVLPLTYFNQSESEEISELKLDSTVYEILQNNSCLDPIESRSFSDIIFQEIGKNIFDHASEENSMAGIISIGMIKKNIWLRDEYGKWSSSYFRKLGGKAYLQIVIGDHGRGIYNTLFKAYKSDEYLNARRYFRSGVRCDNEPYVIRYSFDKLSSRHSDKSKLLFSDIPRGLAWVYDIVREYRGLISVRSGSTRLGISFLPDQKETPKFEEDLACFGGTILQIILPEWKPSEVLSFQLAPEPFPEQELETHWFTIADYWTGRTDAKESYINFIETLDKTIRPLDEKALVFIDFASIRWDKNSLSEFIRKITYLQGDVLIMCINLNLEHFKLLDEVDRLFLSKDGPIKESDARITPFIDIRGKLFFIGCRNRDEKSLLFELFEIDSLKIDSLPTKYNLNKMGKFIRRNRHIIRRSGDQLKIRAPIATLSAHLDESIRVEINKVINKPPKDIKIRHKGIFHLPSGKYAETFLQFGHLFQIANWVKKLSFLLLMKLHFTMRRPSIQFIFGCTASSFPLIQCIAEELSLDPYGKTLCIDSYLYSLNHPDIEDIPERKNILIVTDVISTGGLVNRMVRAVMKRNSKPVAVVAIADIRQKYESVIEVNGENVCVYALYHEHIPKYSKPYKTKEKGQLELLPIKDVDVTEIDPLTASPCYAAIPHPPVIIEPKEFVENYIVDSFAIINRHVVTGGTHFCYYIDTKMIFENEQIFTNILDRTIQWIKKDISRGSHKELTFLYPSGSNAAYATQSIISKIKDILGIEKIDVRGIFRSRSESGWKFGTPDMNYEAAIKDKTLIIWDDGSNSGDTLYQLIDYASSFRPRKIFVYILISRLAPFHRRFSQQIRSYNAYRKKRIPIKITFITSLDLPTYRPNNCPCCRKLIEIESDFTKAFSSLESVNTHLEREKRRLKQVRLRNIHEEIRAQQFKSLSELTGKSEEFRRKIVRLIQIRELISKLESDITTEKERQYLREELTNENNLKMLIRIIRDEPEIWDIIVRQLPDVSSTILQFCTEVLLGKYGEPDSLDVIAIEILFSNGKVSLLSKHFQSFIIRLQRSNEAVNTFLYHVLKYLKGDERLELMENCREICESMRSGTAKIEGEARVKIGKAIQWARFDRAKKAGRESSLKEAIVSLFDIYREDPHKSGLSWWNTLLGTSVGTDINVWGRRYSWWKDELNLLMEKFVKSLEALQPILSVTPSVNPYLLISSKPNLVSDLIYLDEKLHILCMHGIGEIVRKSIYEDFRLIVKRIHLIVVCEKSDLAKVVERFPTTLSNEINSGLEVLKATIKERGIKVKIDVVGQDIKVLFNRTLFYTVFREIMVNISKRCEKSGTVEITQIIGPKTVEVVFKHPGKIEPDDSSGMGESIIKDTIKAHKGNFFPARAVRSNEILTRIEFPKW